MLKTIFDLPKSKDELEAANSGFSSWKWIQKAPLRDIKDEAATVRFSDGNIVFRWDLSSSHYFMPSKCFVRMRCQYVRGDNTRIQAADGIAPTMNLLPCLLNECSVTMNDQQISICDRHVGEVDTMYQRLNRSGQAKRDMLNSTIFLEPDVQKRIGIIAQDAYNSSDHYDMTQGDLLFLLQGAANLDAAADQIALDFDNGQAGESSFDFTDAAGMDLRFSNAAINGEHTVTPETNLLVNLNVGDVVSYRVNSILYMGKVIRIRSKGADGNGDNRIIVERTTKIPLPIDVAAAVINNANVTDGLNLFKVQTKSIVPRQTHEIEVNWTPRCLSFFRLPHAMTGGCKYELILNPKNLYREAAIESILPKAVGGAANNFNFRVTSLFLYVPTFEGKSMIERTQYYLDLNEIRCQKVDITSQETSYTLDIRPSTNAIAIAIQAGNVDNVTNYASSVFRAQNDYQLKIESMHVRYGAEQKPIPNFAIEYNQAGGRDYWNEVYIRNLLATGGYFDSSGESIEEYYAAGNYVYQIWNRSGDEKETRIYITIRFNEAPPDPAPKS